MNAWEAEPPKRGITIERVYTTPHALEDVVSAMDKDMLLLLRINRQYSASVPHCAWLVRHWMRTKLQINLKYGCRPTEFIAYFYL